MPQIETIMSSKIAMLILAIVAFLVALMLVVVIVKMLFGGRLRIPGGRARQARLGVVDAFEFGRQRQLIIVRRDNTEHLIMIGGPNDLLIESEIVRVEAREARDGRRDKPDMYPSTSDARIPAPAHTCHGSARAETSGPAACALVRSRVHTAHAAGSVPHADARCAACERCFRDAAANTDLPAAGAPSDADASAPSRQCVARGRHTPRESASDDRCACRVAFSDFCSGSCGHRSGVTPADPCRRNRPRNRARDRDIRCARAAGAAVPQTAPAASPIEAVATDHVASTDLAAASLHPEAGRHLTRRDADEAAAAFVDQCAEAGTQTRAGPPTGNPGASRVAGRARVARRGNGQAFGSRTRLDLLRRTDAELCHPGAAKPNPGPNKSRSELLDPGFSLRDPLPASPPSNARRGPSQASPRDDQRCPPAPPTGENALALDYPG